VSKSTLKFAYVHLSETPDPLLKGKGGKAKGRVGSEGMEGREKEGKTEGKEMSEGEESEGYAPLN
jgi:hypothetical protein